MKENTISASSASGVSGSQHNENTKQQTHKQQNSHQNKEKPLSAPKTEGNSKNSKSKSMNLPAAQMPFRFRPRSKLTPQAQDQGDDDNIPIQISDVRFIEQIYEKKHGRKVTRRQVQNWRRTGEQSSYTTNNPYNQINFNTGLTSDQWQDKKKRSLSKQDLNSMKEYYHRIIKMVDKGQHAKYTLKDLSKEFNLDQSVYQTLRAEFKSDPNIAFYMKKNEQSFGKDGDRIVGGSDSIQNKQISVNLNDKKKKQLIDKILQPNPLLTLTEVYEKINKLFKNSTFRIQLKEVDRIIELDGYRYREVVRYPHSRNFRDNIERKVQFCQRLQELSKQKSKFGGFSKVYFLGLSCFHSYMFRKQGWTKQEYLIEPFIQQNISLLVLAQISGNGTWKFQKQIQKDKTFLQTAKKLFDIMLDQRFEIKYIVIDFALFKYAQALRTCRSRLDIEIIWIPPFCHNLNPLEFWFQQIRSELQKSERIQAVLKKEKETGVSTYILKDIIEELRRIFKENCTVDFNFKRFFVHAIKVHREALQGNTI